MNLVYLKSIFKIGLIMLLSLDLNPNLDIMFIDYANFIDAQIMWYYSILDPSVIFLIILDSIDSYQFIKVLCFLFNYYLTIILEFLN